MRVIFLNCMRMVRLIGSNSVFFSSLRITYCAMPKEVFLVFGALHTAPKKYGFKLNLRNYNARRGAHLNY